MSCITVILLYMLNIVSGLEEVHSIKMCPVYNYENVHSINSCISGSSP